MNKRRLRAVRIITRRMAALPGEERGVSLVELIVGIAIAALVMAYISTAVVQFYQVTRWGNSQLFLASDFQTASLWLGRDAAESAAFTAGAGNVYGTLSWADGSNAYRYSYSSLDQALVREHLLGGVVQSTLSVARHIANQSDVTFSLSADLLTVSLTATSGGESETATFEFALRVR